MYTNWGVSLICCTPNPFDHVIILCGLCLENTISLAVMVPHKIKHPSPNEVDDSKVSVSMMGASLGECRMPGPRTLMTNAPVFRTEDRLQFEVYFQPCVDPATLVVTVCSFLCLRSQLCVTLVAAVHDDREDRGSKEADDTKVRVTFGEKGLYWIVSVGGVNERTYRYRLRRSPLS